MPKKVIVGMSGGVDSSVAAYLLKQEGYEVIGIFMKNWDQAMNNDILGNPTLEDEVCPEETDFNDAKQVCDKLGIELRRVDFSKEYWDKVFKYFLDEYKAGRTPNPDLFCNKFIKFGDLWGHVNEEFGEEVFLATGHYCDISHKDGTRLLIAKDSNKDQTYFLSQVSNEQLKRVLFPLGKLEKPAVRKIAEEQGLITADKKDSTGICFIGERHFKEFLTNYIPNQKGDIVDINTKEKVGEHVGSMYYTIGQNKNLGLGGAKTKYFVCQKDVKNNILYVTSMDNQDLLYTKSCNLEQFNWISPDKMPETIECRAKFRYRSDYTDVILNTKTMTVEFKEPIKSVTPGQGAVFYTKIECIAGAIIK